ncbi:MAG TPA: TraR/DksA C4-type zinc finger protein [Acidimicrobiia bacterium]|jgi:DnaK suppressor protein|nr:TraR/DksA C4-type zinc finger protein [Acidimicrobiia bacterium]
MALDIASAERALRQEREQLVHQLDELGAAESGDLRSDIDFGGSFADAAAVTAERTEVLGVVESLKSQLDDVDTALARIEGGTYGTCDNCRGEIDPDRLEFRPASVLCVSCKTRAAS